jgi:hypothetical protein
MSVCVYSVFVLSCVRKGFATGRIRTDADLIQLHRVYHDSYLLNSHSNISIVFQLSVYFIDISTKHSHIASRRI